MSKTAVRKKIDVLGLKSGLRLNGNQFAINADQEKLIKSLFFFGESESKSKTANSEVSDLVRGLQSMIKSLQDQIDVKDKQIQELSKGLSKEWDYSRQQAEHLAVFADQSQKLQLAQMQPQLTNEQESEQEPLPVKRGWFSHLFR